MKKSKKENINEIRIKEEMQTSMQITITRFATNPNLYKDIIEILELDEKYTEDLLSNYFKIIKNASKKKYTEEYRKVFTLIERIKFIKKLNEKNGESEFESLKTYLALTCIDMISKPYINFEDWIKKEYSLGDDISDFPKYIDAMKEKYYSDRGMKFQFFNYFENMPIEFKEKISKHLTLRKIVYDDLNGKLIKNHFKGKVTPENASDYYNKIISYLFSIRNKYTHNGLRIVKPSHNENINSGYDSYEISIGEIVTVENEVIEPEERINVVNDGFDLISTILEVAIYNYRNTLTKNIDKLSIN